MKTRLLIIGAILIVFGISSIPLLSVYSLFTSIPIMILGGSIVGLGFVRLQLSRIVIMSSPIIAGYYLITYSLMVQSQALT